MGKLLMLKISYLSFLHCKLALICSMHDTGFKVLSMKIKYIAPFKHKHKHQKLAHENYLPRIPSLHGIEVMTFSIKASLQ
jgi:hypothetical protein